MREELHLPWRTGAMGVFDSRGVPIGVIHEHDELSEIIALRVNCHDKLVEALEDCIAELEASRCSHIKNVIAARAALALAKEQP